MTVQCQLAVPPVPEFKNLDWISTTVDAIVIQNKWYTPLPTVKDVKAFYLIVEQTNNGAAAEDLEVELTIDGTVYTVGRAGASGTQYYVYMDADGNARTTPGLLQLLSLGDADQSAPLQTRSLGIRVRQTSVVDGVAANIEVNMVYEAVEENATVAPLIACRVPEYANLDWISTSVDAIVVQNKWYTPLPLTKNVKAFYLIVEQTNNGAAAEDLEVELTIDGTANVFAWGGAVSGAVNYAFLSAESVGGYTGVARQLLSLDVDQSAPLETRSLQIRVRQTSAVDGVAANIEVNMVYVLQDETQITESIHDYKNVDWISTSVDAIVILNKWYTPLPIARGVKAWYLIVEQTNNGAAVEDIEVELTINGVAFIVTMGAAISGAPHYIRWLAAGTFGYHTLIFQIRSIDLDQSVPLETKSLQVRVRQTSAVDGVAANIEVNLVYEELEPTMTVQPQLAEKHYEFKNLDYDTTVVVDPIVINDWYTALDTIYDVEGWYLIVEQTNNGATAEDIVLELTIDGTIYLLTMAALASGAAQYIYFYIWGALVYSANPTQIISRDFDQSAPLETKSLKIRVRQITVVDLVSAVIEVNMVYAQKENM